MDINNWRDVATVLLTMSNPTEEQRAAAFQAIEHMAAICDAQYSGDSVSLYSLLSRQRIVFRALSEANEGSVAALSALRSTQPSMMDPEAVNRTIKGLSERMLIGTQDKPLIFHKTEDGELEPLRAAQEQVYHKPIPTYIDQHAADAANDAKQRQLGIQLAAARAAKGEAILSDRNILVILEVLEEVYAFDKALSLYHINTNGLIFFDKNKGFIGSVTRESIASGEAQLLASYAHILSDLLHFDVDYAKAQLWLELSIKEGFYNGEDNRH